jgi:prophage antirepressor-like protein/phage anti-repressor protein
MFDKRKPLPLPPMGFRDVRFEVVHVDEEPCLRSDQIGEALQFDPPAPEILELYQAHRGHFSDFITRVVAVTVDGQARPMRVFTLWGALTLAKRAETPEAPAFEAWITELLMLRGYSLQWEIIRLHGENGDLWGKLHDLEARLRLANLQLDELRAESKGRRDEAPPALDAEFRRVFEERTALLLGLAEDVKAMRGSWAGGPARFQGFLERATEQLRDLLDDPAARTLGWELPGLAKAVTDLRRRLDTLNPARRDVAKASRAARQDAGVPAPAVPDLQFLRFAFRDEATVWGVLFAGDATPWLSAADIGRLAGLSETRLAGGEAEVERLVPAGHRTRLDNGTLLVDPVGVDTLLFHWGDILDEGQAELMDWLSGEVVPALHAAMLQRVQAEPEAHPGFPGQPTEAVADEAGLFKVWAGELDGHPCRLVNARDLYKCLKAGWKSFAAWFRDHDRAFAWREGRDYRQVYVRVGQYDPYLSLDAALQLLALEKSPAKAEAQAYLQRVALGQPATIEGVATVVREGEEKETSALGTREGELLPVTFQKTTLFLLNHAGEPYVPMRPVVEGMGLNWDSQLDKLTGNEERWSVAEIATVAGDGKRRKMSCIPLRRFFGWLMTISPNKVSPEAKEVVIAYQHECDEVLWQHWNKKFQQSRGATSPQGALPDTPPREPLVFDFQDTRGHVLQLRVPIQEGRAACVAVDAASAIGEREPDFLKWYAGIPKRYHGALPSLSGETVLATLSAEGLGYLFGQRAHRPEVEAFREFWFGTVEPVLAARRAGGVAKPAAAQAASPEDAVAGPATPPETSGAADADLRARFGELARRLWKRDGNPGHAEFPNAAAILARLWPLGDGEWLAIGSKTAFAGSLGLDRKSLDRGLKRLRGWGLVEARPEGAAWPAEIRPVREKVRTALREAGLDAPEV